MKRRCSGLSRREFVLSALCASTTAALTYGVCFEPGFLRRSYYQVPVSGILPGGRVRILHMADLHYGAHMPLTFIEEAFSLGLETNPDLIAITGDLIDVRIEAHQPYRSLLRRVASRTPTFVTMGNHDGGKWARGVGGYEDSSVVRAFAGESKVRILHNASIVVEVRGSPVRLVGLGDLWAGELDALSAFGVSSTEVPTVLLSHNPDSKDLVGAFSWQVMLSGHTHGGQLRVPITGQTPFAPVKDHRYVAGLNRWRDRFIHTSTGVATTSHLRVNCRPEVTILDLIAT